MCVHLLYEGGSCLAVDRGAVPLEILLHVRGDGEAVEGEHFHVVAWESRLGFILDEGDERYSADVGGEGGDDEGAVFGELNKLLGVRCEVEVGYIGGGGFDCGGEGIRIGGIVAVGFRL